MTSTHDLTGRTALVTGSTSGIGEATARRLAESGAYVLIVGRDEARGDAVVSATRSAGGKADFLRADLRDARSSVDLAERALRRAGGQIDVLVNNAGTGAIGSTEGFDEETFDSVLAINLKAPFYLVGSLAPMMAARGNGVIINVTTMVAQFGVAGMGVVGASKAALNLLTKSWAAEYGPFGVRVNAVSPGPTRTSGVEPISDVLDRLAAQSPLGYVARPDEIAAAITYLASDDATYVHGTVLNVDGGRTSV